MHRCTLLLLFAVLALPTQAFTTLTTPRGTLLRKTAAGGPDYGDWGYIYAPTAIRSGADLHLWTCGGVATLDDGDSTVSGGDHNFYIKNWLAPEAVNLCPKYLNERTSISLCNGMFRQGYVTTPTGDYNGVCDPTVVRLNGTYHMYYTADPKNGTDNQMFLAKSYDGRTFWKHPNNQQAATPVLPFVPTARYGIGEGSAVYNNGTFYLYYTDAPWFSESTVRRATSSDGVSFGSGTRIYPEATIPFAGEGTGGVDVKYIPGWNLWLMITPTASKQDLTWNISRDGLHWLPWTGAFGHTTRLIPLPRRYATAPGIEGNESGHVGDGTLAASQTMRVYFTAGDSKYVRGCAHIHSYLGEQCYGGSTNPQAPDEPTGFWQWTIDAVDFTLNPQPLSGYLDGVDAYKVAFGWAYDKDTGTNDAASNGSPSAPLGHDTWVRAVAFSTTNGQRYEGAWQAADGARADLVTAGVTPDKYHGFGIALRSQGFPAGTYRIRVEGGEFPTGMGARELPGEFTVTLP